MEVVLIEIPLYVIDNAGDPVKDLKPEEITLYENGREKKISHFILVENDSPQIASIARKYPSSRRQILLFFDFAFSTPSSIIKAREACLDFVENKILPTDLVGIATYSNITGLQIISHFTTDREQLFHFLDTLGLLDSKQRTPGPLGFFFPKITQPPPPSETSSLREAVRVWADDRLGMLEEELLKQKQKIYGNAVTDFVQSLMNLSIAMNTIKGRKHIIFFSEGFDSRILTGKSHSELGEAAPPDAGVGVISRYVFSKYLDSTRRYGDTSLRMVLNDTLKNFATADCSIHSVDIGGLRTQAGSLEQVSGEAKDIHAIRTGHTTLALFSKETGGQTFININDLDRPLEDLLRMTNTYYIVGYYPEDMTKEGKFRKIKISTKRPVVHLSYRKGYHEPKPYSEYSLLEKRLQIVEYIVKDIRSDEIPFESCVSVFPGKQGVCRIPVFFKFAGKQLLEKNRKISHLEIFGYAITSKGIFKDFFHQDLKLSLEKKNRKKLEACGVKHYDMCLLPPGDYTIRLIVRDADTGDIGSRFHEISVPDYSAGAFAVSGPFFHQSEPDWFLSRGFDPKNPTGRKAGVNLPLDYPYVLKNETFVPGINPVLIQSSPVRFFIKAYNVKRHPKTQDPLIDISYEILDGEGKRRPLYNVVCMQHPVPRQPGAYELTFQANFQSLPPGPHILKLTVRDLLANEEVVSSCPFYIESTWTGN